MNIKINSVKFDADKKLEDFIEGRVTKLNKIYDDIVGVEIFLKLDNNSSLDNKISEIKVEVPGNDIFVKKQSKSFEESTDLAVEALKRQLKKHKEKQRGL
ncbi:MAG TPA: ribosome-associated translation inhibitor RaiA [Bacteroidales bacterium]|nr:MAG: ribosomal subunit interface protein [Bacteroidetes bacterium GWF2_33_38]OFY74372.1 MAG: ribosomal subunit interface protein [Bacteroidetes bacterium RIFOXYA12_FULL_33_9]OFY91516.1 MAG: ribosomal subunit interface protein [Bacteroidetes bacterium RIFOXYA2_FULL_33_7]HBF88428.1 ribosome-associated translation inhibitor RaiA [Bacteroidales bacterium]